jgi:hypothetical protein
MVSRKEEDDEAGGRHMLSDWCDSTWVFSLIFWGWEIVYIRYP